MKKIDLVVFDMAGTTVDEDNLVYKTVQKVINDRGFVVSLENVLKYAAGKEKHMAIKDTIAACTSAENVEELADVAFSNFKPELDRAYDNFPVKTFPGVEELFVALRNNGVKVVLNTGYDRKTAVKLLGKLNWEVGKTVDALITASDVINGRPSAEMIEKAMKMFGVTDPSKVLKAGDSIIDIEEGKNANCGLTIGVLSGAQNKEQLQQASPDYILNDLTELKEILL